MTPSVKPHPVAYISKKLTSDKSSRVDSKIICNPRVAMTEAKTRIPCTKDVNYIGHKYIITQVLWKSKEVITINSLFNHKHNEVWKAVQTITILQGLKKSYCQYQLSNSKGRN